MTIFYTCSWCLEEMELDVQPIVPGCYSGPPENCYPESGGEIDPEECPKCGHSVNSAEVYKRLDDKLASLEPD